jgi:hypothetical protein
MKTEKYHRLESLACWIDEETLTIYPCDVDGAPNLDAGVKVSELNPDWFQLLNGNDKDLISNLHKNKNN